VLPQYAGARASQAAAGVRALAATARRLGH